MRNYLKQFASFAAAGTLVFALAACDDDPIEPPPGGGVCEDDPNTLACAVENDEVVYDTTGTQITIQDRSNGVAPRVDEVTWSSDYEYLLDGYVFVNDGQTLNIEPGTVIKAEGGVGTAASALIVARGGTIMAEGTVSDPIIFTSEADDLSGDLGIQNGLWGGVVILGHATINTTVGVGNVEGIPTSEPRGLYGCDDDFACDDNDNSGVFRYVSIRHAGTPIAPNNELNGLTLGAVGSGTTVEYVEIFANQDDGIEWFGGTVNTKYLVAAFVGDDLFDYDEGWRGNNQFWFGIHPADDGGSLGEHDGGTSPVEGQPYAMPTIYNATYIGSGVGNSGNGVNMRDNAGGFYYNSIISHAAEGYAVSLEEEPAEPEETRDRLEAGDLEWRNNLFGNFWSTDPADLFVSTEGDLDGAWVVDYMTAAEQENVVVNDAMLAMACWEPGCGLDPAPAAGSPALSMELAEYSGGFFMAVDYAGAFAQGENWMEGWTAVDQFFGN